MGQVGVHLPGRPEDSGFLGQAGSLSLITNAFCVVIIPFDFLQSKLTGRLGGESTGSGMGRPGGWVPAPALQTQLTLLSVPYGLLRGTCPSPTQMFSIHVCASQGPLSTGRENLGFRFLSFSSLKCQ